MTDQPRDTSALVEALRMSVAAQSGTVHPGQLRLLVEESLGPERTHELRREIHQVVVAAEEHLPTRMTRISPLTASSLARLSSELASSRGWAPETAERATRAWAAALGFDDLSVTDWPAVDTSAERPRASIDPATVGETARPPTPAAPEPPAAGWPRPPRRLAKIHATATTGEPALGVVQSYAGIPFALFAGGAAVVLIGLCVTLLILTSGWAIAAGIAAAAAFALTNAAKFGALVATESGVEFVPYVANMRRPKLDEVVTAPWRDVRAEVSTVSAVDVAGTRVQVGPRNRRFAEAVAARAGRS